MRNAFLALLLSCLSFSQVEMTGVAVKGLHVNAGTPQILNVVISPNSVQGGTASQGTVNISLGKGETVLLSSSSPSVASVPASVSIPKGATSATFNITTTAISADTTVIITATLNGSAQANILVKAPTASGLSLNPTSVIGGTTNSTGTVTINSIAPTGGIAVALSSSNTAAATVPANVTVAAGQTSATFTVTTLSVSSNTTSTITATLGAQQTAVLTITAGASVASVSLNPNSVTGGTSSTGTVTLTGAAPAGGAIVSLSSSNTSAATVPSSVTVAQGSTTANFTVTTFSVAFTTTSTISATKGTTQTAILTVNAPGGTAADTLPGTSTIGWQQLASTSPSLVAASPNPGGTTAALVYAWSSGFYDRTRRRFCVWGGGHVDYAGNEFYCIQLDANPASVSRMDNPSACTGCTGAPPPCGGPGATDSTGATNDDGSPRSTHTYDSITYDPIDDLFIARSLESTWFNSCGSGKIWTLPGSVLPHTNLTVPGSSWSTPVADYMNGTAPGGCGPACASGDFDPNTQVIYYTAANLSSGMLAFNPSSTQTRAGIAPNTVSTINNANSGCYNCTSIADPADKKLIQLGDSGVGPFPYQNWCIDPSSTACTYGVVTRFSTPPTGCPSFTGSAPGADYDPVTQTIVIWPASGNPSTSNIFAYNPSASSRTYSGLTVPAGQCVNLTSGLSISGSGPAANVDGGGAQNNGTYKRFRYVDYCDCFIVLNAFSQNAFIVRTRTHTTPNLFVSRTAGVNVPGGSANLLLTSPLNGGQPMNAAVVQNCTNGGVYFGAPTPPNGSCNGTGWTLDAATVDADDAGMTAGSWNSVILAGQASSGNIFTNFSPTCCGSANNNVNPGFGLGQEFFVQYRVRYDANAISNANWPSGGGFKQDIVREEDHFLNGTQIVTNACAGDSPSGIDTFNGVDEIVLQEVSPTTFNPNHPFIYTHCPPVNNSEISITNPQTGHADQIDQNAVGCYHGDPFTPAQCDGGWCANDPTGTPAGNCFDYRANDWMTVQKHVIVGSAWGQCCSKIEVWLAHDGQPAQLAISLSDWILGNDDPTNGKYGKLWNDLFNTGTTGAVATANVWYDNVIAAKRRIPDPDVSVPNAPDNLTLVNLTPSCTGSTCQVQVNWRVNSQNKTAQDDEGMVVERASVGAGVSDWVPFANQNNSNSGGNFAPIATLAPGASTYTDTGRTHGTTYIYRVRAFNTFGNSAYAASMCVRNNVGSSTPAQPWSPTPQNPCGGTITP